jgi:putative colanic acid biosynthesis UDP-glucose lipid carrier transferase
MSDSLLKEEPSPAFVKTLTPVETHFPVQEPPHVIQLTVAHLLLSPLEKKLNVYLKRIVDIVFSAILIVIVFPWLLPLLAFLIKIDSKGPVFFLQKRNNMNVGVFTCIKFRSMHVNKAANLLPGSENDTRVTRIGKFLRHHHLDELPQLFNVWMGDMSIVGPRPHMISDNQKFEELVPHYNYRHKVKPGITGLAQVLGYVGPVTNVDSIRERVGKDIYYVRYWSFALDAKIACQTIFRIIGKRQSDNKDSKEFKNIIV